MLLCAVCVVWTVWALRRVELADADTAGVLAVGPGVIGAVLAGWGLWASLRGNTAQRTAEQAAAGLAQQVLDIEGRAYRELLGNGAAALRGPIDLAFTAIGARVEGVEPTGTLNNITHYYRQLRPGRLVITGTSASSPAVGPSADEGRDDAGTGKTVLVLKLILGLAGGSRAARDRVPVRLTAADWPGGGIGDWLATHLKSVHRLPSLDIQLLRGEDLLLPVIDGLDELDPDETPGQDSRAAALLRVIDAYGRTDVASPVALTCRNRTYRALTADAAEPTVAAEIAIARTERGRARWQPVLDALIPPQQTSAPAPTTASAALARALDTPWRLTLAATVFEERAVDGSYVRAPEDLIPLAESGRLHDFLLDRYVTAALQAHRSDATDSYRPDITGTAADHRLQRYLDRLDPVATHRCLATLAAYLHGNSVRPRIVAGRRLPTVNLVLHELWPLLGLRRVRTAEVTAVIAAHLAVFAAAWCSLFSLSSLGEATRSALLSIPLILAFLSARGLWRQPWPVPQALGRRPRSPFADELRGRGTRSGVELGVFSALFYSVIAAACWLWAGPRLGVPVLLLALVMTVGAVGTGALYGLGLGSPGVPAGGPLALLRDDFTAWLCVALTMGVFTGVVGGFGFASATGNARTGVTVGVLYAVLCFIDVGLVGSLGGSAALRYCMVLLCARRRLPLRLGRLLHVCHRVGVLRSAGGAYQFRHRELQDHLAVRHGVPRSGGS